jgi:molecular chaperone GrpE
LAKKLSEFGGKLKRIKLAKMEQDKDKFEEKDVVNETTEVQNDNEGTNSQEGSENDLDRLTAELAEAKDKYLRLYADFENFRRRTSKEKIEFFKSANEEVIKAILPILDDFERAQKSLANIDDGSAAKEGMQIIYNKFYKILEQKGLKPMDAAGTAFNPEFHEAITQIPAPSEDMKGKVIDEVEKGYFLNDKVIRFAKVVTGS